MLGGLVVAAPGSRAAFPGTNGRILFVAGSTLNVYSMNADGSGVTQLTHSTGSEEDELGHSSADAAKVVFRHSPSSGGDQIWVMNADGSGQTQLTSHPNSDPSGPQTSDHDPAFSPDGMKIVFSQSVRDHAGAADYPASIWVMNADGSGPTQLTFPAADTRHDHDPVFSPDGTKIVFDSTRDYCNSGVCDPHTGEVYVMSAGGSGVTRLTIDGGTAFHPNLNEGWSPDGSKILFSHYDSGLSEDMVSVMNANGSSQTELAAGCCATFSPDGTQIAFGRGSPRAIWLMNANGTNQHLLSSPSSLSDGNLDWAPGPSVLARYTWQDVTCATTPCASKETYSLDGSASTSSAGIKTWKWTFDDGSTADGEVVTHQWPDVKPHLVKLEVTDNDGAVSDVSAMVQPCKGDTGAVSSTNGCVVRSRFTWLDTACRTSCSSVDSYKLDGSLSSATVPIADWKWAFDDGSTADGQMVTHPWPDRKPHWVTLRVTDRVGDVQDVSAMVRPCSGDTAAPTAGPGCVIKPRFTWKYSSCGTCSSPAAYRLDGSLSVVDAGVKAWKWTFDDGTTDSSGPIVTHRFADAKPHTVTLEITDNLGGVKDVSAQVQPCSGDTGAQSITTGCVKLSGTVRALVCSAKSCKKRGLAGATVTATGPPGQDSAQTDAHGAYTLLLEAGTYTVSASYGNVTMAPDSVNVALQSDVQGVDFESCAISLPGAVTSTAARLPRPLGSSAGGSRPPPNWVRIRWTCCSPAVAGTQTGGRSSFAGRKSSSRSCPRHRSSPASSAATGPTATSSPFLTGSP